MFLSVPSHLSEPPCPALPSGALLPHKLCCRLPIPSRGAGSKLTSRPKPWQLALPPWEKKAVFHSLQTLASLTLDAPLFPVPLACPLPPLLHDRTGPFPVSNFQRPAHYTYFCPRPSPDPDPYSGLDPPSLSIRKQISISISALKASASLSDFHPSSNRASRVAPGSPGSTLALPRETFCAFSHNRARISLGRSTRVDFKSFLPK